MRARSLFVAAAASVLVVSAAAHAAYSRAGDASVSFVATGPAGLKIVGTTGELQVADNGSDIVITVPLRNLDTKIDLRNKHMKEKYLEVSKYPNAELRVPRSALQTPKGAAVSARANGSLTLHGKTQPASFSYTASPDGANTAVTGAVHVNMTAFGIEQPGYMGISVKPDVDVSVAFRVSGN